MRLAHSTNIHEAGHGIMTVLTGFRAQYITNIPDATSGGRMYWAPGRRIPFGIVQQIATSAPRAQALIYVAGVAAVRELLREEAVLRGADDECSRAFARTIYGDEDDIVASLLTDAQRVFANEHVRNATIAIAARLERDFVVAGTEIERRVHDVGLPRIVPLPGREQDTELQRHAAIVGSSAFVDAASRHYFFSDRRRS